MTTLVIGVYKKEITDREAVVGVFIGNLEGYPVFKISLSKDGEAEVTISNQIKKITEGIKDYTIDFFEGIKIVSLKGKKVTFIKTSPYFSHEKLISLL